MIFHGRSGVRDPGKATKANGVLDARVSDVNTIMDRGA